MFSQASTQQIQIEERKKETMGLMEKPPTILFPLLLHNLVSSVLISADKSLFYLSERYKLLKMIRYLVVNCFLFFLKLIPSSIPTNLLSLSLQPDKNYSFKTHKNGDYAAAGVGIGDSGISRALSQLLASVNDIPVSSRKYEIVRSLAERLIEENCREGIEALREMNRVVLSAAFSRTLCQLEAAMAEHDRVGLDGSVARPVQYQVVRVLLAVRSVGDGVWGTAGKRVVRDGNRSGNSAEKMAAELLWLAQKLAACGFADEAVEKWASASNLASLSLLAEPRLQASLVKVTAFLFNQAKNIRVEEDREESSKEKCSQTNMKMITSWLPLLCRGSNGSDVPVLSISERADLEKILEDAIEKLEGEEQEQVLSVWLHHFTYCPSSDWPNLYASYARWCTASRKALCSHLST
ncbi:1,8-cineole synthase [Gossypium australe]|uniref:1,8-cineole synthase n=1 Tax=Gossypium australe TaxID=47621 RepID=A0A5B6V316_9ROSI|nr:1,8-cineole synthase [Gossypium australe]